MTEDAPIQIDREDWEQIVAYIRALEEMVMRLQAQEPKEEE